MSLTILPIITSEILKEYPRILNVDPVVKYLPQDTNMCLTLFFNCFKRISEEKMARAEGCISFCKLKVGDTVPLESTSAWPHFTSLLFLVDVMKPRKLHGSRNMNTTTVPSTSVRLLLCPLHRLKYSTTHPINGRKASTRNFCK